MSPRPERATAPGLIGRRDALRGALGMLLAVSACGSERARRLPPLPSPFDALRGELAGARPGLQVFPGAGELVREHTQRFPFGLADAGGTPVAGAGRAWISQDGALSTPFPVRHVRFAKPETGEPPGFFVATMRFPRDGVADILVEASGSYGATTVQVRARPHVPAPGARAVRTRTPTRADPSGVGSLCTRRPACGMHELSLDQPLGKRPVVLTIGSPALCTSRVCGPVVDEALRVRASTGARAAFIHLEPFAGNEPTTLGPAARAWRLESEPWTFVIDAAGIVRARFEGPVVAEEIEAALASVL